MARLRCGLLLSPAPRKLHPHSVALFSPPHHARVTLDVLWSSLPRPTPPTPFPYSFCLLASGWVGGRHVWWARREPAQGRCHVPAEGRPLLGRRESWAPRGNAVLQVHCTATIALHACCALTSLRVATGRVFCPPRSLPLFHVEMSQLICSRTEIKLLGTTALFVFPWCE